MNNQMKMKRVLKFRAWDKKNNRMILGGEIVYHLYGGDERLEVHINEQGCDSGEGRQRDFIVMQFTGLLDKNGKEIYEGDILRVKHGIGDGEDMYHDGYYSVTIGNLDGIVLSFRSLSNNDKYNQYPIHTALSLRYATLDTDFRNERNDRIAVTESYGKNSMFKETWKQNHYSNNLEVIGNIYENPDLLKTV